MIRTAIRGVAAALITFSAFPAVAQLNSDTVPTGPVVPLREAVDSQIENSRWRIGPLRVDPTFSLGNLGYNDNVYGASEGEEKVDDYTASASLGLKAIAPLGRKTFLLLDAAPSYTWYKDLDERRRFGFGGGGSVLFLFNRISFEVETSIIDDLVTQVSSEDSTLVPQSTDRLNVDVEVDVLPRVALFAGYSAQSTDYDPEAEDLSYDLLNRDETAARVGVRYKFRPRFNVYAMVEATDADFPDDPDFPNAEGEAILAGVEYERDSLFVNIVGGRRTIDYSKPSDVEFDEFTGSIAAGWRLVRRTQIQVRASRSPKYSIFIDNPYFLETRQGARLVVPMGSRYLTFVGGETGKNEYQTPVNAGGVLVERVDDETTWEAGIGIRVFRSSILTFSLTNEDYQSNVPGFDREVVTTGFSLSLGGLLF
ncbi:MAG: outer membrane beta-barrel protein [Thermoanaerobaculia bacterium]